MDELLSEAMNTLTFEERNQQEEALHGVDRDIAEEGTFFDNALKELDSHLVRQKAGTVYETAETMSADYVSHRAFRIMFLRSNRYDAKAAADRMLGFFEMKQKIFGNEKLVKDITIDDLDEDDRACLRSGWTQLCGRDKSGRMVIAQLAIGSKKMETLQSELRARYFMIMTALKSEQTQLRGSVWIIYTIGEYGSQNNPLGFAEVVDISLRCPMYAAAVHFLTDAIKQYLLFNMATRAMPIKLRARVRLHFGSHLECQYLLSSYGIWRELLPLTPNTYSIERERHLQWYQSCFSTTTSETTNAGIVSTSTSCKTTAAAVVTQPITDKDILYMGGKKTNTAGNVHLQNLVTEFFQTYDESGTSDEMKRSIVNAMIDEIHRSGGRFLMNQNQASSANSEQDADSVVWATVPSNELRTKIMQMFRNRRRSVRGCRKKKKELRVSLPWDYAFP